MDEQVPSKDVVAKLTQWRQEADSDPLGVGETFVELLEIAEAFQRTLRGIESCHTCEECRQAAMMALGGAREPPAHEQRSEPATGRWYAAEDIDRLVRELDVLLNGEARAAKQAMLCDIVGQVRKERLSLWKGDNPSHTPPPSCWQPIETAPVQMDPILMTDGKWYAAGHVEPDGTRKFRIYHFAVSQEYDWTPTHWMPLPAGPTETTEGGR